MIENAAKRAEDRAVNLRQSAVDAMNRLLGHEVRRLQALSQVNDHIRPQEIRLAQKQQEELAASLQQSRLRLDSLRLVWKGPVEALR